MVPPHFPGYEVLEELGRGGMGIVYKARQTGLHRLVALKVILAGASARLEDRIRFQLEGEALASLQHPNVVQVYEVGEQDGVPFLALEYVDGITVHKREPKALSQRQVHELLAQSRADHDRYYPMYLLAFHTGLRQGPRAFDEKPV